MRASSLTCCVNNFHFHQPNNVIDSDSVTERVLGPYSSIILLACYLHRPIFASAVISPAKYYLRPCAY